MIKNIILKINESIETDWVIRSKINQIIKQETARILWHVIPERTKLPLLAKLTSKVMIQKKQREQIVPKEQKRKQKHPNQLANLKKNIPKAFGNQVYAI